MLWWLYKEMMKMALIKCPECGGMISEQAYNCVHCGYPINHSTGSFSRIQNSEGIVIIYGLRQTFLIGGTISIYLDGKYYDSVKKGASLEIKITKDTEITAKCGINAMKGNYLAKAGKLQKIQIVYDRLLGTFMMQEIDVAIANSSV